MLAGLNYAISFVLLQTFSLVLATKQPAMTAACLVGIIREEEEAGRREEVARFFAQLVSSQIAAALGNIVAVAAGAVAFNFLWQLVWGRPFLSEQAAAEVFHALSPLNSGTLFFAAWTGVLLWAASLAGGWIENFAVYHRCAQALRDHPWRDRFGRERIERWAVRFEKNIAGWGTNISLGFLLGMTPAIGAFLGLPLEVRHVTLSTGQLAVAAASMQEQWWYGGWFLRAALGIAVMFVLNLSVSFLLSLFTAARAYGLRSREVATLLAEIGRRFLRQPGEFLLPPKK
jgi:site-specific recombinase